MMKKFSFVFLGIFALTLSAVEIPFNRKPLEVTFETKGGGIRRLAWQGHLLSAPDISFTERAMTNTMRNGKEAVLQEFFYDLEFTPRVISDNWNTRVFELSARGTGAFDWMRLTKTYTLHRTRDFFLVKYTLENLDKVPHSAALWVRTFFRDYQNSGAKNIFNQGGTRTFSHPGDAKSDEWCVDGFRPFAAVYGAESKKGVMFELPANLTDSMYSWFSLSKPLSTMEFSTREVPVLPGKKFEFTIKVNMGAKVPALAAAAARKPLAQNAKLGKRSYVPEFYAAGKTGSLGRFQMRSGNTVKPSERSVSLSVPRQFHDSVRETVLPANADLKNIGVYEVANKCADYSREVPFRVEKRGGKNVLLFPVPGFKFNGHLIRLDPKKRVYRDREGRFVSLADYDIQICFDRPSQKKFDTSSLKEANLFANSDFSKLDAKGMPVGWVHPNYYWSRKLYSMKDGAIRLRRPAKNPSWAQLYDYFVPEPDRKYTFSVRLRNDNLINGESAGSIGFYDAAGKPIPKTGVRFYSPGRAGHDWKEFKVSFYAPAKAVFGRFGIVMNGLKGQTISADDVKLVPEPYSPETVKLVDRLRDQLKSSWYKPLDLIERNSHAVVTPHEKWLKPAAFAMPDILFLPHNKGNYASLERRVIVELFQRMTFKYTMIPLLARVSFINGSGIMGVYSNTFVPELEPYTIERLKTAPRSKVIWISELDFKKHVKAPFMNFLRSRAKESNLFFLNCQNIPAEFLGKSAPLPPELLLMPRMRNVNAKSFGKVVQFYKRDKVRSCVMNTSIYNRINNPVMPSVSLDNHYDNYTGREFPYWEFEYLTMAKAVRHLAGVKNDAVMTGFDNGKVQINAAKAVKAELEYRYEDLFRQVISAGTLPVDLKAGSNRIALPAVDFGNELTAYLKLSVNGKYLDAAGVRIMPQKTAAITVKFPKGRKVPFGQAMPIEVAVESSIPGKRLTVKIEDADYRVVASAAVNGKVAKLNFVPKFPRTVFYRVMSYWENNGKIVATGKDEFIFSGNNTDPKELVSVIWSGSSAMKYPLYKAMTADHIVVWCLNTRNPTRVLRNLNMEPAVYGSGSVAFGFNSWHKYRGEVDISTKLSARQPCFSDPKAWESARKNLNKQVKDGLFTRQDVKFHMIGDEQFLGRNVCISEHCLKDFRNEMKKYYKDIAKLNADWGTGFASFDQVMPKVAKDVTDKSKLGQFVAHKLYMTRLFAEKYMGGIRRELKKAAPSTVIGLSGTANPGYHFDWPLVMKQLDYLAFYDGIQRKLAQDFANPGALGGQWYGGYVAPTPHEGYINSYFWRGLLSGNRLSAMYTPYAGITGDLLNTPQLEYYAKLLKESRKGIAKLVLSSTEKPEVAMVYSQSSLFAITATIGINEYENSLTGWHALMGDLGIDYKFLYAPELPETLNNSYKVLILPGVAALSDAELAAIRRFAANGGTVIADMTYGVYNDHGTLRKGKNVPVITTLKLPEGEFRTTDAKNKLFQVEKVGKGKIVTWNLMVSGYQQTVLGGVGGEVAQDLSGSAKFCAALRKLAAEEFQKGGVTANRSVIGKDGKPRQVETVWKNYNGNFIFGIWKFDRSVPVLDPGSGEDVTVKLPVKGHIYDVRSKKYIGYGNSFQYRLFPGGAGVYAVLRSKPGKLSVSAPAKAALMGEISFKVSLPGGGRVFNCELFDPSGVLRYSRTLAAPEGKAAGAFQLSANKDKAGKNWTLKVTDTASGVWAKHNFDVK
ncbi:MAG: beta-galactosidase trimerization domain-containing protein [Lentisphaeria bacterium]|nr:beta-galactosidase trimerization domain-containing protein [Lentisphaeria bacterium]